MLLTTAQSYLNVSKIVELKDVFIGNQTNLLEASKFSLIIQCTAFTQNSVIL